MWGFSGVFIEQDLQHYCLFEMVTQANRSLLRKHSESLSIQVSCRGNQDTACSVSSHPDDLGLSAAIAEKYPVL